MVQCRNTIQSKGKLANFLSAVLPPELQSGAGSYFEGIRTSADFIRDVEDGIAQAPMSIHLTPHILSVIDWTKPFEDPIR
jgi:lysine 2,3-aminomutase